MSAEAAPLLYREIARLASHTGWGPAERVLGLAALLEKLFVEATRKEQLAFSSLFARVSYAGHKYGMPTETLQVVHSFRRLAQRARQGYATDDRDVRLGVKAMAETVLIFYQTAIPAEVLEHFPAPGEWQFSPPEVWEYKAKARVVALRDDPDHQCLIATDEEDPARQLRVRYNLPERNANFNPTIQLLRKVFRFPVALNLLEVDIDAAGDYRPRAFVVEPDFLVDVSAVSECFKDTGPEPLSYLVKKFLPHETTAPILLGNIANFFLDRLLQAPESRWEDLIRETFQLYPFVFAAMSDAEVKDLTSQAQRHFVNLKQMALEGFAREGIEPSNCVLEPTFFSEEFGLQGRLDLFYHTEEKSAIVELKSGKPFKPNSYGISRSHFTQTLLYDLLVRSVFGRQTDPAKYILYSGADQQPLRFAPTVAPEQMEAIQLRNQLVGIERLLADIRPGDAEVPLFERLRAAKVAGKGFLERDFARFETVYNGLGPVEKKYFNAFSGFIAREQWMAKVGDADPETPGGQASIWRNSFAEKQQAFAILSHLEIADNRADQPDPQIIFRKTARTNPLANFRTGDIAVLYPAENEDTTVIDHQVIKCTITEITRETVTVAPRYQQFNLRPFESENLWNLEPDLMDSGFVSMYRGLFEWAGERKGGGSPLLRRSTADDMYPDPSNVYPNPSPEGEGSLPSDVSIPLPLGGGVGSGVNVEAGSPSTMNIEYSERPPKTGSFGEPEETTDRSRWHYLKPFIRAMRKQPTPAEKALWTLLRNRQFQDTKFRRQHAIGDYIADFASLEYRLVVEVDGTIHDFQPDYDQIRTEYLQYYGFEVLRFSNEEVSNEPELVKGKLRLALDTRKKELQASPSGFHPIPDPSPEGEGSMLSAVSTPLPFGGGVGGGVKSGGNEVNADEVQQPTLTPEQSAILQKIISSRDFFLLWGPPGTGKTSVMLRALAGWVLHETDDNLLLLAYTNRAVDEICEALDSLGGDVREKYLRIGSRFATNSDYKEQLLSAKISGVKKRSELRGILDRHRIFVSTVASFTQNEQLLRLKKFQRLVVDEASQLTEPQIVGLLTRFEHFTLIGDHRQLPAVTAQHPDNSRVTDPDLLALGLNDLRDSYFERLFRRCVAEGRHESYDRLSRQGRMDAEIMAFPNEHFYDGLLKTLNDTDQASAGLLAEVNKPVLFLATPAEDTFPGQKTNRAEAELAARLTALFQQEYARQGLPWRPDKSLGIITPWRAQIAQIRESLSAAGLDPDSVTVDTVERYQGGARDVILISCCVNSPAQLGSLVSLSAEGVDRKLNVALTRARQQLVVLGNADILNLDERYREFIARYRGEWPFNA